MRVTATTLPAILNEFINCDFELNTDNSKCPNLFLLRDLLEETCLMLGSSLWIFQRNNSPRTGWKCDVLSIMQLGCNILPYVFDLS